MPVEDNTTILAQQEAKIGEYDVLYQKWCWDGIIAESLVFADEDISNLQDHEVEELVRSSPLVDDNLPITMKRSDSGFTFASFNFDVE